MKLNSCGCAVCESLKNENISEYDLHVFVGMHIATHKSALRVFKSDLHFSSVTHWDLGKQKMVKSSHLLCFKYLMKTLLYFVDSLTVPSSVNTTMN